MGEIMRPLAFSDMVRWIQGEAKNSDSVFGIRKDKFYKNKSGKGIELFGTKLPSPLGPAAGPHCQLAENILAAYLAGSRFIELKTVQIMDGEELRKCVARPCINAQDEGYNVEWSTELTVPQAFEEYVKAWFLLHLFSKEFGLADTPDFLFNMSVGYSLEGIQSPKIDTYIEGMKNAKTTAIWKTCYAYLAENLGSFERFTKDDLDAISGAISNSITLSTLHGCPREEIEGIAHYLLTVKGLNTYIKCNPTLLGYESARRILHDMGYPYLSFDDHHFKEDLQFTDAVGMLKRLTEEAKQRNLLLGVKITNTFPVEIKKGELPGTEMYMSGRALFPLSITVAKRLSDEFNGTLPISYAGGVDYFNLPAILETGIRPITMATTLLKPGGYERLMQLAELAEEHIDPNLNNVQVERINALVSQLKEKKRYRKAYRHTGSRKTPSPLPLFDCAKAPCKDGGCPLHQQIPEYLAQVAQQNFEAALKIIAIDNTAPSITGTICDHQCQFKCNRVDYEDSLQIRYAKGIAAEKAEAAFTEGLQPTPLKTDKSVAIIGAGPAGIGAAIFLRRNGVPVTVYEKRDKPYGIVRYMIPAFRISEEAIERDYQLAVKSGVAFKFGVDENYSLEALQKEHPFVVLALGAWKAGSPPVKTGEVYDALKFLEDSKQSGYALNLGKQVGVIGGGDVAMDCARAAKRNKGVEQVTVVYRRTRELMPAQQEEKELAFQEGVEILECLAPEHFVKGTLTCEVMTLGDDDASGRRNVKGTGKKKELQFDTVIGAVGARVDTSGFVKNGIDLNDKGFPQLTGANETSVPNVYIAGDCKAGPATVVKAIADGKTVAADILEKLGLPNDFIAIPLQRADINVLYWKKGVFIEASKDTADAYRCLSCEELCEICCDVCPNRANVAVQTKTGHHQVVHIDRLCNECGNCAVFCPHSGKPYTDKFTLFSSEEDFINSRNKGFLRIGKDTFKVRLENHRVLTWRRGETGIPWTFVEMINLIMDKYAYLITEVIV
jgi:putative selenate reductase